MTISKALKKSYDLKHKVKKKANSKKVCDYCGKQFAGESYSEISLNKCRSCDLKGY